MRIVVEGEIDVKDDLEICFIKWMDDGIIY